MIAIVDTTVQAANPSLPLYPWRAYVNSPSSLRVRNVPRRVGNWSIDRVYVTAAYPDNSLKTADCVLVGGVWVCTIEGSSSPGESQNGYTIYADGVDENGDRVTGYVLGKGCISILETDGTITPGETTYYVHLLSSQPASPKEGDLWQLSGSWYIWQDGTAYPIGDDSGLISQLSSELSNYVPTSRTINSKALSSDLTLNAADVGALSSSGDATLKATFPYPASLTIEGALAGGGKLVIGGGSQTGDSPAKIVLGEQDANAYGASMTLHGGTNTGASINLVDTTLDDVEAFPQLKSEITIGDVKVRESIGKLQNSITNLESIVGQANTALEEIA